MSVNVANVRRIIIAVAKSDPTKQRKDVRYMQDKVSGFRQTLSSLLDERLTKPEAQSLIDEGFKIKKPTRKTAVMIALYKKAVSGDLSAIREVDNILSGNPAESYKGTVTIIDDIRFEDLTDRGKRL